MSRRALLAVLALLPLLAACGRKGALEQPPPEDEKKRKRSTQ